MRGIVPALRDAWRLAAPYWQGEERGWAWLLLLAVVGLNLAQVGLTVVLTYWQRAFYNALEARDWDAFLALLFTWRHTDAGVLPGFVLVAAVFILVAVYGLYLRQALEICWRAWLTARWVGRWTGPRTPWRLSLAEPATDNPDQRLSDDLRYFVERTLALGLGLLRSAVSLASFAVVLWSLSGPLTVLGVEVPGYMLWVALAYSTAGTWLAHRIGRRLVGLNFARERVEADYRYALVRVRDHAEGIAFHDGEAEERRGLLGRFALVTANWRQLMVATKRLTFFTAGFSQVAAVFPIVVAAPAYFAGRLPLGGLIQTASAFGQVQEALSWFVSSYSELAEWRATVERLDGFDRALGAADAMAGRGPSVAPSPDGRLVLDGLTLALPGGRALLEGGSAAVAPGEAVLVTGASGSGKSTLLRAVAGLWPFGAGRVARPGGALFLPQRPYLPLGSLRRAVCYPADPATVPDGAVRAALVAAGLGALADRLDSEERWDRRLSGGEQQRLAVARALVARPRWLFLDEATASLDPEAEAALYGLLRRELPGTGIVSVAHRPAVARFHDRALALAGGRLAPAPLPT